MRRSFALRGDNAAAVRESIDRSPANVIVCGDMNDVTTSHVYRVIKGDDLRDVWTDVGSGYGYTFNSFGLLFPIDHVLYRGAVRLIEAQVVHGGCSDHYPVVATFELKLKP